jgi:hyperosmotically inducible protein
MRVKSLSLAAVLAVLLIGLACSDTKSSVNANGPNDSYKDQVETALKQAELTDVTVSEDADKNTITLGGKVHTQAAKEKATETAQAAAGGRNVVNEISVEPAGAESASKSMESNLDTAIEKNYKAELIAKGLDKQHIRYDAKNGALTLKGSVKTEGEKKEAEQLARNVPNVQQVENQIEVKR